MTAGMYDRTMQGAIVGYGFIASQGHVPGYAEHNRHHVRVDIVAVADICEARRREAQRAFPMAVVYEDYRRMLDNHARNLDFVDITVPPALHAEVAHSALDRGLHVLCEKPLATNVADAIALAKNALRSRRVLFPCHNYRHAPTVCAIRHILEQDIIGSINCVTQQTFRSTHARGVPEWRPDWRRELAYAGGGILMDHGSHTLYLAFEWFGGYPQAVSARTYALDGFDTEDNVNSTFCYAQGIGHAVLSWTAGARKVLYTLHGTRGEITVDDDIVRVILRDATDALPIRLAKTNGVILTASHWTDASHKEWFANMFADFAEAIDKDAFVSKDARDAIECMNAIEACYASERDGGREVHIERPLELDDITGSKALACMP